MKHAHTIEEYISFYQQGIDASCISIDKEKELDLFSYLKTRIDNDDTMFLYAVCLERGTGTNKQLNKAIEIYEFLQALKTFQFQVHQQDCFHTMQLLSFCLFSLLLSQALPN